MIVTIKCIRFSGVALLCTEKVWNETIFPLTLHQKFELKPKIIWIQFDLKTARSSDRFIRR